MGRNVRSIAVGYENTLPLKGVSDESDEHQFPIILRVLSMSLDEL